MKKLLLTLAASALLAACGESTGKETGETGYDSGDTGCPDVTYDTEIDAIEYYWYDSGGANGIGYWEYYVDLIGWADLVTLDLYQSQGGEWTEYHEMNQGDYDPCGAWDSWNLTLDVVDAMSDYSDNSGVTLNDATDAQEGQMTFMVTVYDTSDQFVECGVWGAEQSVYSSEGCSEITF